MVIRAFYPVFEIVEDADGLNRFVDQLDLGAYEYRVFGLLFKDSFENR